MSHDPIPLPGLVASGVNQTTSLNLSAIYIGTAFDAQPPEATRNRPDYLDHAATITPATKYPISASKASVLPVEIRQRFDGPPVTHSMLVEVVVVRPVRRGDQVSYTAANQTPACLAPLQGSSQPPPSHRFNLSPSSRVQTISPRPFDDYSVCVTSTMSIIMHRVRGADDMNASANHLPYRRHGGIRGNDISIMHA
jgi:hypothetical protein